MRSLHLAAGVGVGICALLASAARGQTMPGADAYSVVNTLKIGGEGRWDYIAVGAPHELLVTRSTHTQLIDGSTGQVIADIKEGKRLHGAVAVPQAHRGFITDGGAGQLIVFDLNTHAVLGTVAAADDADGIVYDAGSDRVVAACGDAGVLALLDPNAELKGTKCTLVDLGGKPESVGVDGKGTAYVCLNDKNEIAVVDLKSAKVTAHWKCGSGTAPTGLSVDPNAGRIFVGCRNNKLIVMDTAGGKVLAELPIGKGNDACAFDPGTNIAFASCGDGTVAIVHETSPAKFEVVQTLHTKAGARTMAVDPSDHALYLPTAAFGEASPGKRPAMQPGTFMIIVAKPKG